MTIFLLCPKNQHRDYFLPLLTSRKPNTLGFRVNGKGAPQRASVISISQWRATVSPAFGEKDVVLSDDWHLSRLHQLLRIREIRLRNPDLLLEVVHHVFAQTDFSWLLSNAHLVNFVL